MMLGLMVSRTNTQQKRKTKQAKASEMTVSASETKPKCQPSEDLLKIISLVGLAPPDFDWYGNLPVNRPGSEEGWEEVKDPLLKWVSTLPNPLRSHLLEHMHKGEEWEVFPPNQSDGRPIIFENAYNVVPYYRLIAEWHETLLSIAKREKYFRTWFSSVGFIDWGKGTVRYKKDRFAAAIDGFDLRCIRECSKCRRLHCAKRLIYKGEEIEPRCSSECAHNIRQSRYEKNKEKYQLTRKCKDASKYLAEQRKSKKKRAQTSVARSKRP